jgi:3-oxoacyl-[acyl-carrier protein] reductase
MDLGIRGKTALVTASSKGLGYAAAKALSNEGATVLICSRDRSGIEAAAESISRESGNKVIPLTADLSSTEDRERLIRDIHKQAGGVDIFVSNTGGPKSGEFLSLDESDWSYTNELVLMSAVRLTGALVPGMLERGWGRIIYITSISARQPIPGLVLSNANRAALTGFAKTQAAEWASKNVLVNCVCPGYFLTERMENIFSGIAAKRGVPMEEILKEKAAEVPAGRFGSPDELAAVIAFLCSERASYLTGTSIQVDGGLVKSLY